MVKLVLGLSLLLVLTACDGKEDVKYPYYRQTANLVVPDSLKPEYREWIKETVRAASENMTGGDYEDADETIVQAETTAKRVFGVTTNCLTIFTRPYHYYDKCKDFTAIEQRAFNSIYGIKKND